MPTLTQTTPKTVPVIPTNRYDIEPDNIEEVENISPELYEELEGEFEEAKKHIAKGELRPMTTTEIAAAVGFKWPK